MNEVPIVYSFLYYRIRNNCNGIIDIFTLREIVARNLIRNGGIPRILINEIIKDMSKFKLIERMNRSNYKILDNDCYKRMNYLIF